MYNTKSNQLDIHRGDIFLVKMNEVGKDSCIQGGDKRPCIIVSNNKANYFSPVISIAPFTSQLNKNKLPTHIKLDYISCGLEKDSIALFEQIMPIDKNKLVRKVGRCPDELMQRIDMAIMIQMGIIDDNKVDEIIETIHSIDERANDIGFDIEDASYRDKLITDLKIYSEQLNCNYLDLLNKRQNTRYKNVV